MSDRPQFSRRHLLVGSALAGAAAATAGSASTDPADADTSADDPRRVVLRDTPHTRAYYALARD